MDLNTLAQAVVDQLTRIADAAQASVGGAEAGAAAAKTGTAAKGAAAGAKPAAKASAKPKVSRETMEKALLAIKDHPNGGKPAAQEVFNALGYAKMTEIAEKDFDKIFAAAEAKLALLEEEGSEEGADDDI
jgi:hypothetical protein